MRVPGNRVSARWNNRITCLVYQGNDSHASAPRIEYTLTRLVLISCLGRATTATRFFGCTSKKKKTGEGSGQLGRSAREADFTTCLGIKGSIAATLSCATYRPDLDQARLHLMSRSLRAKRQGFSNVFRKKKRRKRKGSKQLGLSATRHFATCCIKADG